MATATVNGIDLYYREAGSGQPLLLVHGTGFNADVWDKVLQSLAQTHRTIAYDRRAYYRTRGDPPRQRYNEQHAEDLVALLRALEATPATILAWSAGAFYAWHKSIVRRRSSAP